MATRYEVLDEVRKRKGGPYDIVFQRVKAYGSYNEGYRFAWTDKRRRIMGRMAAVMCKEDLMELMRKAKLKGWF